MGYINQGCFNFWCYSVLPLVYDDSLTYMEMVCKLIDYCNHIKDDEVALAKLVESYGTTINELQTEVDEVMQELEDFKNGKALGVYLSALQKWIDENLQELVGRIAKFVIFGLDNRGYFVADIPDNWDGITFSTDTDYSSESYGHLILTY